MNDELVTKLDVLAECFADAMAAANTFWLGADRRMPGDKPIALRLGDLDGQCLIVAQAIIDCADLASDEQIDLIKLETPGHHPRAAALDLILYERARER